MNPVRTQNAQRKKRLSMVFKLFNSRFRHLAYDVASVEIILGLISSMRIGKASALCYLN